MALTYRKGDTLLIGGQVFAKAGEPLARGDWVTLRPRSSILGFKRKPLAMRHREGDIPSGLVY